MVKLSGFLLLLITVAAPVARAQDAWVPPVAGATNADERRALAELVHLYDTTGGRPGSVAAEFAARASFALADDAALSFQSLRLAPGHATSPAASARRVARAIAEASTRARNLATAYATIVRFGNAQWTVAALVRQGEVYETLAHAFLGLAVPADGHATPFAPGSAATEAMLARVESLEGLAIARYALAARLARGAVVVDDFSRAAIAGLARYSDEDVTRSLVAAHAADPSIAPPTPGEFDEVRRGRTLAVSAEIAPPPLTSAEP